MLDSCTTADYTATVAAAATTDHRSRRGRGVPNIPALIFVFGLCPHRRSGGAFVAGDRLKNLQLVDF